MIILRAIVSLIFHSIVFFGKKLIFTSISPFLNRNETPINLKRSYEWQILRKFKISKYFTFSDTQKKYENEKFAFLFVLSMYLS